MSQVSSKSWDSANSSTPFETPLSISARSGHSLEFRHNAWIKKQRGRGNGEARAFHVLGVGSAFAGTVSAFLPRRYEAVARVLVNPQDSNALGLSPMDALAGNGLSNDIVQQTQVRVLQSNPVAWDVIKQLRLDQREDFAGKLASTPVERVPGPRKALLLSAFHAGLHVEAVPETELIEVRFRARDPQLAANVANAITGAYIERTFRTRYEATVQASDWLSKQLDDLKKNVEISQQRFTEYQKKSGIIGTDETHNIFIVQLEELNKQMAGAKGERILREARYRVASAGNPEPRQQMIEADLLGQAIR